MLRPLERGRLRRDLAGVERVQHSAQGCHGVALRPADVEAGPAEQVGQEALDQRWHPAAQRVCWNLADEFTWVGSGERDSALTEHPSHVFGVAVGRPLHVPPAVVDVQPLLVEGRERLEVRPRSVGTFEMVRPVSGARRDLVVELAKCSFLLCRDPVLGDHQKVAVAVEITGSERERAGQVRADEGGSEDGLDTENQLSQELVQLRKAASCRSRLTSAPGSRSSTRCVLRCSRCVSAS